MGIKIIITLAILAAMYGIGVYIKSLQEANAVYKSNAEQSKQAIIELQEVAETNAKDAEFKRQQVAEKQIQLAKLHATTASLNRKLKNVTKDNKSLQECLATPLPDSYIDQLRNVSSRTVDSTEDSKDLP